MAAIGAGLAIVILLNVNEIIYFWRVRGRGLLVVVQPGLGGMIFVD